MAKRAVPALVAASAGAARDGLLADLVEGARTAAFAVGERAGVFDPGAVTVTADGDALTGMLAARGVAGLRGYDGALLVISHDGDFLSAIGIQRRLCLAQSAQF